MNKGVLIGPKPNKKKQLKTLTNSISLGIILDIVGLHGLTKLTTKYLIIIAKIAN